MHPPQSSKTSLFLVLHNDNKYIKYLHGEFLYEVMDTQLPRNGLSFVEPKGSGQCSKDPTIGPCPTYT